MLVLASLLIQDLSLIFQNMNRYFNTSGPNRPWEHYTLMRPDLIEIGEDLVRRERYFTIWAPRQTGKSTYFQLLAEVLKKKGYRIIHFNAENYLDATKLSLLEEVSDYFAEVSNQRSRVTTFKSLSDFVKKIKTIKVVMIIDEIEGLNPKLFGQFLHTIRNLYHSRKEHCLKSVILLGVNNIVGVVEDNASPFNIADNINIPFFTKKETFELLEQHEQETGQLFDTKVKEKISEITANQPGLVNGFAAELVSRHKGKSLINFQDYTQVEDWYLREAMDKNVTNIVSKAKKYRSFIERLLFLGEKVAFFVDRPAIKALFTNGVIDRDSENNVKFKVPLYKKRLYYTFYPYLNGENLRIRQELWAPDYFKQDGRLNFDKLIDNYKEYVNRRGFRYFREKDPTDPNRKKYLSLKEAALVYSFESYIQAFLQEAGGRSYLEPHAGLGQMDLFIFLKDQVYIIEFKIYGGPKKFMNGKKQLAYYCRKEGLQKGVYLVFVANHIRLPKVIVESIEMVNGVEVTTYLVEYDEEKDF